MKRECPNCEAVWGFDEIDDQYCAACGWPHVNDDDNPDWYGDDEDGDDDATLEALGENEIERIWEQEGWN